MATINLLPNGTESNDWTLSTGLQANLLLDDNHTGSIGSDGNRLTATSGGADVIVTMDDFTEDFNKIDSVQLVTRSGNNVRSTTFSLATRLINGSAGDFYVEGSGTVAASIGYQTQTYTERETSDGSNLWTNANLNDMRVRVSLDSISAGTVSFTYCYVIVDYTPPLTADNSIFFGTNF